MHSITDIAKEMYPDLVICDLDYIKHDQQLVQDAIEIWKKDNCQVLIYSLDNFVNDRPHIESIRSQYEKFAFTTPGVHKEDNHISNVDYLTMFSCGNTQPVIDQEQQKKYDFVYLVGKLHDHRMYLLEALAKKGILEHTLLSLRNPSHAYDHLLPKHSALPEEYEWQDITKIGDFQAGWHSRDSQMAIAFNKNIGIAHPLLYRDTAFSIVSETNIDPNINYITEKTWTPIVAEHLIISHGNKGNNYFLEQLGLTNSSHTMTSLIITRSLISVRTYTSRAVHRSTNTRKNRESTTRIMPWTKNIGRITIPNNSGPTSNKMNQIK